MKISFNSKQYLIILFYSIFSVMGLSQYYGSIPLLVCYDFILLIFALTAAADKAFFFDILMAFYLTMGFFLKLNISLFMGAHYYETLFMGPTISTSVLDMALKVSSTAFFAILIAHSFFHCFIYKKSSDKLIALDFIYILYQKYKKIILLFLIFFVFFANYSNYYFEIYTKGGINTYNFFIANLYKYFISIGFIFFILYLLLIDLFKKNKFSWEFIYLIFFENMLSSISQISRAMILTSSSIILGIYRHCKINNLRLNLKLFFLSISMLLILFSISFYTVSHLRNEKFTNIKLNQKSQAGHIQDNSLIGNSNFVKFMDNDIKPMLVDRWIGIEGVIAVCSSTKLSWNFFLLSLEEKNVRGLSFYDRNFINSPYKDSNFEEKQFVTLSGFIAYFFYSGSFLILFFAILLLSLIGFFVEWYSLALTNYNYIIASFVSNLLVYRFVNFGYMPLNTIQYIVIILITLLFYFYAINFLNTRLRRLNFK